MDLARLTDKENPDLFIATYVVRYVQLFLWADLIIAGQYGGNSLAATDRPVL